MLPYSWINEDLPDTGGWKARHRSAIMAPSLQKPGGSLACVFRAWCSYADAHALRYASAIGDDSYLGPAWFKMASAIKAMLDGETGGLDCGTLNHILLTNVTEQGFDPEDL